MLWALRASAEPLRARAGWGWTVNGPQVVQELSGAASQLHPSLSTLRPTHVTRKMYPSMGGYRDTSAINRTTNFSTAVDSGWRLHRIEKNINTRLKILYPVRTTSKNEGELERCSNK